MKKLLFVLSLSFFSLPIFAQFSLDIESGYGFQGYNEIRIPNNSGTTFDFYKDFNTNSLLIPLRIRPGFTFNERNHIFGLYAPLAVNYDGINPFLIQFEGQQFAEGADIAGFYKFNSYRLTYRRDVLLTERWTLGIGFTGKIRDASVRLASGEIQARKNDLGFVPLVHLFAAYHLNGWTVYLEGDGLAGGPGRAFDFFLGGKVPVSNQFDLKAGYRILEGGADVDEVYNFTLINFASIGVIWNL